MEKYETIKLLGSGTYGTAYKVKEKATGQHFVVKRINLGANSQRERDEAYHEVKVLSSLRHPHIVPYVDCFWEEDDWDHNMCMVMACCDKGDLHAAIQKRRVACEVAQRVTNDLSSSKGLQSTSRASSGGTGTRPPVAGGQQEKHNCKELRRCKTEASALDVIAFSEDEVWRCCVQLLLALQYLHAKHILHRDVKVHNIFLSEIAGKPCYMLGDFGVSKCLDASNDLAQSQVGTLAYLSPQIVEGKPYGAEGDMWALGCMLHEMCTLNTLFTGNNPVQVLFKVMGGEIPQLGPGFSADLQQVVGLLLTRSSADRPSSAQLLHHPIVAKRVKMYLEELERAGPQGWSSWRSFLLPSSYSHASDSTPLHDLMGQVLLCQDPESNDTYSSHSSEEVESSGMSGFSELDRNKMCRFSSMASEISDAGSCMSSDYEELRVLQYQLSAPAAVVEEEEDLARVGMETPPFMSVAYTIDEEIESFYPPDSLFEVEDTKQSMHIHEGVAARHRLSGCLKYANKSRMEERILQLRERISNILGVQKFDRLHHFLKSSSSLNGSNDDLMMRSKLGEILDDTQFDTWPLMEELLFLEEHS